MRAPVRPVVLRPVMVAVVGVVLAAAGCGWDDGVDSRAATAGLPSIRADVEARDWVLDAAGSSVTVPDDVEVTLSVDGDSVSGRAPCNAYHGTFDLGTDGSVEVTGIAVTQMACEPAVMDAEAAYLAALEAVDEVEVEVDEDGRDDADRLVLTGPDDVRLSYRSYDAHDLLVGTWAIVDVATADAIQSVVAGSEPTVTFAEDGTLALDTGCNTGGGDWELDDHDISVGPVFLTKMACDDPPGVMEQEAAIVSALESAAEVEITPGSLTLLADDGRILLDAQAA